MIYVHGHKGYAGRCLSDMILMCEILILQPRCDLSDREMEYQIMDRQPCSGCENESRFYRSQGTDC